MTTNAAVSAQGSTLGVSLTQSNYTLIKQLTDFTIGSGTASKLDASNLDSTEKEYIAGLSDHGALTLKGQYIKTDAGQQLLKNNQGNGVTLYFEGTLPDGQTGTWDAQCAEFSIAPGTDKVLEFTATIWPKNFVWGA